MKKPGRKNKEEEQGGRAELRAFSVSCDCVLVEARPHLLA